jgi:hypothetical protein
MKKNTSIVNCLYEELVKISTKKSTLFSKKIDLYESIYYNKMYRHYRWF